jgi:DNA-binding NarL/FixJ family response regulator
MAEGVSAVHPSRSAVPQNEALEHLERTLCHLVTADRLQADLLRSCIASEFPVEIQQSGRLRLKSVIGAKPDRPCLYLLDCLRLDAEVIGKLLDPEPMVVPEHVMIVLYNIDDDRRLAPLVKRHKIRGIFFQNSTPGAFIKGLGEILNGHLWLSRKMLANCVTLTTNDMKAAGHTLSQLSSREVEVLRHVLMGKNNHQIAEAMQISHNTVKRHLYNIYKKIDVPDRLQAVLWASHYLRN